MKIKTYLRSIVLNILSLFNRKKRATVVLSQMPSIAPEPVPVEFNQTMSALGSVRGSSESASLINITYALDQECAELYGRNPYY